jgi:hypothetical protein
MVFIPWNDTKVLLSNDHDMTLVQAEELATVTNTRVRLNMARWTLCFALDEDEDNEYFPCYAPNTMFSRGPVGRAKTLCLANARCRAAAHPPRTQP